MNKKLQIILIFLCLIQIKANIRIFGLDKVTKKIDRKLLIMKALRTNSNDFMLLIVNRFYKKGFFTCLECAVFIKKYFFKSSEIKFFIGIRNKNQEFESHAWVKKGDEFIFGFIKDINDYKEILTL